MFRGAADMYDVLSLADELIRAAFGPHPSLDLASLQGYSTFSLRVFALADVRRYLLLRDLKGELIFMGVLPFRHRSFAASVSC